MFPPCHNYDDVNFSYAIGANLQLSKEEIVNEVYETHYTIEYDLCQLQTFTTSIKIDTIHYIDIKRI